MKINKDALWLAKFEIKKSRNAIIIQLVMLFGVTAFLLAALPAYFESGGIVGVDLYFLIAFGCTVCWLKPKEIQIQKLDDDTWASPFFVFLNQLPIKKEVLIQSRMIVFFTYAVPFYFFVLVLLYCFSSPLKDALPFHSYLVFSLIWTGYGISFGLAFPASEAGQKLSLFKQIVFTIALFTISTVILIIFTILYGKGLVYFTIQAAKNWPLISIILSIAAILLSVKYYRGYMHRKIAEVDYYK